MIAIIGVKIGIKAATNRVSTDTTQRLHNMEVDLEHDIMKRTGSC